MRPHLLPIGAHQRQRGFQEAQQSSLGSGHDWCSSTGHWLWTVDSETALARKAKGGCHKSWFVYFPWTLRPCFRKGGQQGWVRVELNVNVSDSIQTFSSGELYLHLELCFAFHPKPQCILNDHGSSWSLKTSLENSQVVQWLDSIHPLQEARVQSLVRELRSYMPWHVKVKVAQSCLTLCDPIDCTVHGIIQARVLEYVSLSLLQRLFPTQGSNPGLPHCRQILTSWATGKPKNTGVGSLSLLQGIFLTQESNWGLLHCRWILYQLSYKGSPLPWHDQKTNKQKDFSGSLSRHSRPCITIP